LTLFKQILYINFQENIEDVTIDIPPSWVKRIEISEKGEQVKKTSKLESTRTITL